MYYCKHRELGLEKVTSPQAEKDQEKRDICIHISEVKISVIMKRETLWISNAKAHFLHIQLSFSWAIACITSVSKKSLNCPTPKSPCIMNRNPICYYADSKEEEAASLNSVIVVVAPLSFLLMLLFLIVSIAEVMPIDVGMEYGVRFS